MIFYLDILADWFTSGSCMYDCSRPHHPSLQVGRCDLDQALSVLKIKSENNMKLVPCTY